MSLYRNGSGIFVETEGLWNWF